MKRIAFFVILMFLFTGFSSAEGMDEISDITPEEAKILDELFTQKQEINTLKENIEEIKLRIAEGEKKRSSLEVQLERTKLEFDEGEKNLSEVLRGFQKRGGANFFEILLNSENLSDLLFKINIFREFSVNTENLLNELEEKERKINEEKGAIEEILRNINIEKDKVEKEMNNLQLKIAENEAKLKSLKDDREKYEGKIRELEKRLFEFDETLKLFTEKFNELLRKGYFPDEMIDIGVSLKGVSGTLKDDDLNELLKEYEVPEVIINFEKDKVKLTSKEYNLELIGNFFVEDGTFLRFKGISGSFYNLNLTKDTIDSISKKDYLKFNFKPILEGYEMDRVETRKGEMKIYMKLF